VENRFHLLYHCKIARRVAHNQKGFSLMEIMLTVGLMTFVVLGNTMFINDFVKRMTHYEKESAEESQMAVLNVMAMNILKKASLSFNRISLRDDNGQSFFDYYPDVPLSTFGNNGDRSILLTVANKKNFYLFSTEEGDFSSMNYDPMHAYAQTAAPASIVDDGQIAYRGLNSVPNITDASGNAARTKLMTSYFDTRWASGKIFILTCPTYLRPVVGNSINIMTSPRTASLIGKVVNDDLLPLFDGEATVPLINTHPVTLAPYNSVDQYFRTLPTVGGASPFVKIEPAQLIRFEMRANKLYPSGYADLYIQKWSPSGFNSDIAVAEKIKSVEFKRKSVTLPLISMEIQK